MSYYEDKFKLMISKKIQFIFGLSVLWVSFLYCFGSPSFGLRDNLHDHVSNVYVPFLFWEEGFSIYQKGPESFLKHDESESSQSMALNFKIPADDVLMFPEANRTPRPLFIVWPWMPRPYPVGASIMMSPFAGLIKLGVAPYLVFGMVIFFFLVVVHWGFLKIKDFIVSQWEQWTPLRYKLLWSLILFFVYQELVLWALSGMYDVVSFVFLVMALFRFFDKKWSQSLLFYSISFFLHYRALYFAPLVVMNLIGLVFELKTQNIVPYLQFQKLGEFFRHYKILILQVLVSLFLCLLTTGTFLITYPSFTKDYLSMRNNPMFLGLNGPNLPILLGWLICIGIVVYRAYRRKSWIMPIFALWFCIMLLKMPFVKSWYIIFLLPYFFMGDFSKNIPALTGNTKTLLNFIGNYIYSGQQKLTLSSLFDGLILYLYLAASVFINSPFEFFLWRELFQRLR